MNPFARPMLFISCAAGNVANIMNTNCKLIGKVARPNGMPRMSTIGAIDAPMMVETEKINTICVCANAWHTDSNETFRMARVTIIGRDNQRTPA